MYPIILHGSENSLDIDAYVIVPELLSFQESKKLCDSFKDINANLLHIKNGVVDWCYKGTVDECNNSILHTYHLHKQTHENPVKHKLERSYALKLARTVRGLLSYHSRTEKRHEVKKALTSSDLQQKIEVLKSIDLRNVPDYEKNSLTEVYKFFAFQLGQTYALLKDNVELFTKNQVADYYPEMAPYLKRINGYPVENLQKFWEEFNSYSLNTIKKVEKHELFYTEYQGKKEVIDVKAEKVLPRVVVFDVDNTLMDETHRAIHRENNDWDTYFDLCHLDEPLKHVIKLTHEYKDKGYEVWVMSGRSESILEKTIASLKQHGAYFDHIKLRGLDNKMPDYVIKPAWARKLIGIERIDFVYDDTDRVIEGFRKYGLNTIDAKELHAKELKKKLKP